MALSSAVCYTEVSQILTPVVEIMCILSTGGSVVSPCAEAM